MKKVLILIDLQNDFITGSLGSVEAQSIIPNVIQFIKNWNEEIIVTKDTHDQKYLDTLEGQYLPVKHCITGTDGFELDYRIQEALQDKHPQIIYKHTFGSTGLMNMFDNATEFYICGLCTDICVVVNALLLRTKYPNNKIFCIENCCAGSSPENHLSALEVMKSCQIEIV
jgi:nicotinamidase-related amidase